MDNGSHDSIWSIFSDVAAAGVVALGGAVGWLWRKVAKVDELSQRMSEVELRQTALTVASDEKRMMLVELKTDLKWLREAVEEIKHRLEK